MKAYCYASGHIEFGRYMPKGALPIARGRAATPLREFIESVARHGYSTRMVQGRREKIPGTETLLVPGIPEAELMGNDPLVKLQEFCKWIRNHAPKGVTVVIGGA